MASDSNDCASVASIWIESLIEQADEVEAVSLDANGAIGSFVEGPLEIVIDVAADATVRMWPPLAMMRCTIPY